MRVVIAPDSFKGSLSASEVAQGMEQGIKRVCPNCETLLLPLSDGGEGLVESLVSASGGTLHNYKVTGPLGDPVQAKLGLLGDDKTAVIEMAEASGLTLIDEDKRNPLLTTTYGTGELILHALDLGCRNLVIGIGGSATNDGGMGMAQALGVRFLDSQGQPLGNGGMELVKLAQIDLSGLDPRIKDAKIKVACDVDNPLTGPQGASYIYGPQKGATPQMVTHLDEALIHYAKIIQAQVGKDVDKIPGAGAAGGLGAGLVTFLDGELVSGIELVLQTLNFREKAQDAQVIFTGEGKLDAQSAFGKVPVGVGRYGKELGVPVIVVAGTVLPDAEALHGEGICAYFSILNQPMTLTEAMENTAILLKNQVAELMRMVVGLKK